MDYEVVIGLEVHSELKTKTKAFCSCANEFGKRANSNTCPVCIGLPGALPVVNKEAVAYTIKMGLATKCDITDVAVFERKNYFYPDLAKAYQISQLEKPLCTNGELEIRVNGENKVVRINRIHMEEDAGKLRHDDYGVDSLVDYNRGGVPLIECVTEPDLRSAEEAVAFVESLRNVLIYTGVSDGKMQEGSLRADVNVSIRERGSKEFGKRTEMKNLNSFKAIYRAIKYEEQRQIDIVKNGGTITQETRRWDDEQGKSYSMRSKEDSQDYRYFPDPDLVPITVSKEYVNELKETIPMLPKERQDMYMDKYGLPQYDAGILVSDIKLAEFFEAVVHKYDNAKTVSNWLLTDVLRLSKDSDQADVVEIRISVDNLVALLNNLDKKIISHTAGRKVFEELWGSDETCEQVIDRLGLKQVSNEDEVLGFVKQALKSNEKSVQDYKAGNKRALSFIVGQVMKASKGKANPQIVNKLLLEILEK